MSAHEPTVSVVNTSRGMWAVRCTDPKHNGCDVHSHCSTGFEAGRLAEEHLAAHRAAGYIPAEVVGRVREHWRRRHGDHHRSYEGSDPSQGFLLALVAVYDLPQSREVYDGLRAVLNATDEA